MINDADRSIFAFIFTLYYRKTNGMWLVHNMFCDDYCSTVSYGNNNDSSSREGWNAA